MFLLYITFLWLMFYRKGYPHMHIHSCYYLSHQKMAVLPLMAGQTQMTESHFCEPPPWHKFWLFVSDFKMSTRSGTVQCGKVCV